MKIKLAFFSIQTHDTKFHSNSLGNETLKIMGSTTRVTGIKSVSTNLEANAWPSHLVVSIGTSTRQGRRKTAVNYYIIYFYFYQSRKSK